MHIEKSYNIRRVSDNLTTSGIVRPDRLRTLASQGYDVVLNLLPDESEYAVPGERQIVESQGIEYIYIPVEFKQPKRSDFQKFSEALDRVQHRKVHIHCAANYRVSAFYSLYEVKRGVWSSVQAKEFIYGVWRPAEHPGWSDFISDVLGEQIEQQG